MIVEFAELHLPVDQPVKVLLRSIDVLHDFYVPEFRAKMDMVPGMITYFWFTPTETGEFEVLCAELCGVGHAFMRGSVFVDTEVDYLGMAGRAGDLRLAGAADAARGGRAGPVTERETSKPAGANRRGTEEANGRRDAAARSGDAACRGPGGRALPPEELVDDTTSSRRTPRPSPSSIPRPRSRIGMVALVLSWLMRLQLGFPGTFTFITPEAYYQFITMHGMIMVIYLLTALFLGGFGNYLIPLMVGARDMVFPYVNMLSYWIYLWR